MLQSSISNKQFTGQQSDVNQAEVYFILHNSLLLNVPEFNLSSAHNLGQNNDAMIGGCRLKY